MCLFWVIAPFHGQHVTVFRDNDGLPPAGSQLVPGNHQVTDIDVVPSRGQAWRRCRVGKLQQPVINGRAYWRHEAMTAGVDFADRKLGGELSEFRAVDLENAQLHEPGGFGGQVNLVSRKRCCLGLAAGIEAKHDDGRRRIGVGSLNSAPGIRRGPLVAPGRYFELAVAVWPAIARLDLDMVVLQSEPSSRYRCSNSTYRNIVLLSSKIRPS